jgi:hypothetical protein
MERSVLEALISQIDGCCYATVDAETRPADGIVKVTTGKRVLLFANRDCSGYQELVHRRLLAAGKNPQDFVLQDLPWGERIGNSPLIGHKGKIYLQCVELTPGDSKFYIAVSMKEVDPNDLHLRERRTNQGLGADSVYVCTYDISHITRVALEGTVAEGGNVLNRMLMPVV